MSQNNKLTEMLKRHEGVKTHAYKCSASKITVGVGRNIDPKGGIGLTEDEIDYLLQNDIDSTEHGPRATGYRRPDRARGASRWGSR